ncbi:MAG: hypothetical protein JWP69_1696 [Flaviaesturariibacter sp.]|nr:hypothetical protein [Flaviaesturariibacter sp.]
MLLESTLQKASIPEAIEPWVTLSLEEYKSLRSESIESLKNQNSILQIGTVSLGALVGLAINGWQDTSGVPEILCFIIVPLFCYVILIRWLGEVERMMRVGNYIALLERRIAGAYPKKRTLGWENWLRSEGTKKRTPQIKVAYLVVVALFYGAAVVSYWLGYQKIITKESFFHNCYQSNSIIFNIVAISILAIAALSIFGYMSIIKRDAKKPLEDIPYEKEEYNESASIES